MSTKSTKPSGPTMPDQPRTLTHQEAAGFYNALGARQDWQAFFEVPAMRDLIAHADLQAAHAVVEFGCGTGAFAEARLARFGSRVRVRKSDGSFQVGERSGSFDRVVSNYLFDLLSSTDRGHLLTEADRLLGADGSLCLVSITQGSTPLPRLVTWIWTQLHALEPRLLGGCRPVELCDSLPTTRWHIDYTRVITRFGIPSEVLVALKQPGNDKDV
jgi:hypothetical protein